MMRNRFLCFAGAAMADQHLQLLRAARDEKAEQAHKLLSTAWEDLHRRTGDRATLYQGPSLEVVLNEFHHASHRAGLAGRTLGVAIRLSRDPAHTVPASLNAARKIVRGSMPGRITSPRPLPRSERSLEDAWSSHACVAAHACAILGTPAKSLRRAPNGSPAYRLPAFIEASELVRMLEAAARIERLAAEIVPDGKIERAAHLADYLSRLPFAIEPCREDELELLALPGEYLQKAKEKQTKRKKVTLR